MRHNYNKTRRGPYRSRHGIILGVCQGIADYFNFSVFWTRVITIGLLIFTGFWPIVGLYILAALLMKPEPVIPLDSDEDQEFYDSYTHSRGMALRRVKRTYDNLNHRLQRMEDIVTDREFNWDQRL
ncbi:MAG: envelope stress response membrane protein PspC, partial [Deltaproteobacteria bacterium]|nr:envelope stress response membrane protein PspC [Deltaproteobacteria bacterium]MBW2142005.1 envelope stress response membrane protein PspC [Deltaproteobacteria bacterium]